MSQVRTLVRRSAKLSMLRREPMMPWTSTHVGGALLMLPLVLHFTCTAHPSLYHRSRLMLIMHTWSVQLVCPSLRQAPSAAKHPHLTFSAMPNISGNRHPASSSETLQLSP